MEQERKAESGQAPDRAETVIRDGAPMTTHTDKGEFVDISKMTRIELMQEINKLRDQVALQVQLRDSYKKQASAQELEARDLTPEEALEEARKRWGPNAIAHFQSWLKLEPCMVANSQATLRRDAKVFCGQTFRECFAKADKERPE